MLLVGHVDSPDPLMLAGRLPTAPPRFARKERDKFAPHALGRVVHVPVNVRGNKGPDVRKVRVVGEPLRKFFSSFARVTRRPSCSR
jgi:hypothetical protein